METKYAIEFDDFLQHQLYISSKSKNTQKTRRKSILLVLAIFLAFSIYSFFTDDQVLAYYFLVLIVATIIFYPRYQRNHYKKHYSKYINENYKNRFGEVSTLNFIENFIESDSVVGESKIKYTSIEEIIEIKSHIFLKLKTGGSLIIPKAKVGNLNQLKVELEGISKRFGIPSKLELDWKWK